MQCVLTTETYDTLVLTSVSLVLFFHPGAPVGTACMAFADSTIAQYGYNAAPGDYGNVVILKTMLQCYDEEEDDGTTTTMVPVWALYGHLTHESLHGKYRGQPIRKGDTIGWMGNTHENGGWPCHLHFQLSFDEPTTHDLPGVVSADDHATALQKYVRFRFCFFKFYDRTQQQQQQHPAVCISILLYYTILPILIRCHFSSYDSIRFPIVSIYVRSPIQD